MKYSIALMVTTAFSTVLISGCSSKPILADGKNVKVTREDVSPKCKSLGLITGSTPTVNGTQEQALEDLKQQAANKGANHVVVKQFSDYGTAVTGVAYDCP